MHPDTRPAALNASGGDASSDPWAAFRIEGTAEIGAWLRQLRDTRTPLVLSAPGGAALVTDLWSIDIERQRVNFTADDNSPLLQQLVNADEAAAVGYLDSVKVQFDLHDLLVVHGPRSCALQARAPAVLYRFQRRNAYRVRTLERHAPTARLRHPAMPEMALALRVLDVSIGGCALFLPGDVPALEPGISLQGVGIELDADTRFTATLHIQHISSINHQGLGLRAGCEWATLVPDSARALQRYIDQTQKRRRLFALD